MLLIFMVLTFLKCNNKPDAFTPYRSNQMTRKVLSLATMLLFAALSVTPHPVQAREHGRNAGMVVGVGVLMAIGGVLVGHYAPDGFFGNPNLRAHHDVFPEVKDDPGPPPSLSDNRNVVFSIPPSDTSGNKTGYYIPQE
jgi:hypothetical protein